MISYRSAVKSRGQEDGSSPHTCLIHLGIKRQGVRETDHLRHRQERSLGHEDLLDPGKANVCVLLNFDYLYNAHDVCL